MKPGDLLVIVASEVPVYETSSLSGRRSSLLKDETAVTIKTFYDPNRDVRWTQLLTRRGLGWVMTINRSDFDNRWMLRTVKT